MRRTYGNTGKGHRHPNYRKHRKRNDAQLRRRRKTEKYANEWRTMDRTTPQTRRTEM